MSSLYNSSLQISLAQTHIVSKDQDKIKNAFKKQQENVSKHVTQQSIEDTEKVVALNQDENSRIVHNDDENRNKNKSSSKMLEKKDLKQKEKKTSVDIVRDETKGNKINIIC